MDTRAPASTARIYAFPKGGRTGEDWQEALKVRTAAKPSSPPILSGHCWSHEAAIREADPSRRS